MQTDTTRRPWPVVLAVVAGCAHLAVGYVYLVSGLAVPGYALLPMWLWWGVLAWLLVRLAARRSWWTPVVPVAAAASWVVVVLGGGALLGWTA